MADPTRSDDRARSHDGARSSDRKHSPDVLAELLGAELPPSPAPDLHPKVTASRAARAQRPVESQPAAAATAEASVGEPVRWETEVVTFQEHRGWRPRYLNGVEVPSWLAGALVHDYLRQRGEEGWELAGVGTAGRFYGAADGLQLYFKRRIR